MSAMEKPATKKDPASSNSRQAHVLPPVMRMRALIDDVFTRYVGPIAAELCYDEFSRWRAEGQLGPGGLHRYISRLARYITEDALRHDFIKYASRCIRLSAGRKL